MPLIASTDVSGPTTANGTSSFIYVAVPIVHAKRALSVIVRAFPAPPRTAPVSCLLYLSPVPRL